MDMTEVTILVDSDLGRVKKVDLTLFGEIVGVLCSRLERLNWTKAGPQGRLLLCVGELVESAGSDGENCRSHG